MKYNAALRIAGILALVLAAWRPVTTSARAAESKQPAPRPGVVHIGASRVYILVGKTGFGHQHAVVGLIKEGSLHRADKRAGRLIFDMPSFAADTAAARRYIGMEGEIDAGTQQKVTSAMLGSEVLDVERFPTASFDVESFRPTATKGKSEKRQFELQGKFTLHGVTQPLKLTAEGASEKGHLHLKGEFLIKQTDYGIRPYKKALGTVGVADELKIYGSLWVKE